jgi:hypothetical protein
VNDYCNTLVLMDEYKNNLSPMIIESLKMLFQRQIRGRSALSGGKIVTDNSIAVNSMVMVAGQEMMTIDVALFSRAIFIPSERISFSQAEKEDFFKLKELEAEGLAQITSELIKLRLVFEKTYAKVFYEVDSDMKASVQGGIDDRLIKNYSIVLAALKIVLADYPLAFTYEQAKLQAIINLEKQYKSMTSSNEISGFFKTLNYLFERGYIAEKKNFRIMMLKKMDKREFAQPKQIFLLRWEGMFHAYAEIARKTGENPMMEESLKYYLETSLGYICAHKVRFEGIGVKSAMAFDYAACEALGLNLTRTDNGAEESDGLEEAPVEMPKGPSTVVATDLPF